ncbi:hypothetical protein [Paenibacillus sp. L3-i20]|uniref:hypothetical protein n=1 Tax=Paenibacillus sp. L3-i20 TaxID=2905833 RepID=UPI001EE13C2C|nr:hypothetical protein [Paenibacillus sp. L3-i20]
MRASEKTKRKISTLLLAISLSAIVAVPFSTASTDGWQKVGEGTMAYQGGVTYKSITVESKGDDFRVCSDKGGAYTLREYDPGTNADENAGQKTIPSGGGCKTWENIGSFVDGTNNRAEFYVLTASSSGPPYVKLYD